VPRPRNVSVIHRAASLWLALIVALALAALMAPGALSATGNGNAFNELTESQTEARKTATSTTSSRGSSPEKETTNSRTVIVLALGAAVLLLVGIAFVIARDARKVAPAVEAELATGFGSRDWAARQRKRRAKAKAARRQRKRNR
jgi:beta-lactamase regulating signal transducer with metallopeptidase domain